MSFSFRDMLNRDCRFLLFDQLLNKHRVDISKHAAQHPLQSIIDFEPELRDEGQQWEKSHTELLQHPVFGTYSPDSTWFFCNVTTFSVVNGAEVRRVFDLRNIEPNGHESIKIHVEVASSPNSTDMGGLLRRLDLVIGRIMPWMDIIQDSNVMLTKGVHLEVRFSADEMARLQIGFEANAAAHVLKNDCCFLFCNNGGACIYCGNVEEAFGLVLDKNGRGGVCSFPLDVQPRLERQVIRTMRAALQEGTWIFASASVTASTAVAAQLPPAASS